MTNDRDTTRIVRAWLRTDEHESADRVLDAVLDQIDTMPQRRAWWPGLGAPVMGPAMRLAFVVAAVFAAATLGISLFAARNVGGPDDTPAPTATPLSLASAAGDGILSPGRYLVEAPFPVRVSFTVPAAWQKWPVYDSSLAAVCKGASCDLGLSFWIVDNLPVDGCRPDLGEHDPPIGPTVDDLATALVDQPGYIATPPRAVTLSGFSGAYLELTGQGIPAGGCSSRTTWETDSEFRRSLHEEHDWIRILDVDGTRLVVDAFAIREATDADRAELSEIVDSILIERP